MSIMRFNYRSRALGRYVDITVVFPTDNYCYYDERVEKRNFHGLLFQKPKAPFRPGMKFQTVYLIHGGSDDDSLTYRYTNAERFAQRNNVMLVTPGIVNSFGVDTCYGIPYQTFLSEELPIVIQSLFASSPKREDNFIMGYAMGGNVALGTALLHPEMFHTCVDISGGIGMTLDTEKLKEEVESYHFKYEFPLFRAAFGSADGIDGSRFDVRKVAEQNAKEGKELCKFHIACGDKEFIRERVEGDVRILKEIGYDVNYILAEGYDHNFDMWNDYIEIALDKLLPLKRTPD